MDPTLVHVALVHVERLSFRKVGDRLAQKRVFRVATELLQNMLHHGLPASECTFEVRAVQGKWTLVARNPVPPETSAWLQARWEELQAHPESELRLRERDALAENVRSVHGGGGLGLFEILRRADGGVQLDCLSFGNGTAAVEFTAHILIPHE
jgi:hypothetical protein